MTLRSLLRSGLVCLVAGAVLRFAAVPVRAWNPDGHMLVAFIAYRHLTPAARVKAGNLLKLNPFYASWTAPLPANASAERKRRRAFILAGTWADDIKGAAGYVTDGPNNGNTPPGTPQDSQNIGYPDHNRHKYWHFVDKPFSDDGTATRNPDVPNVLTEIVLLRNALADPGTPDGIKSYDLVWLIHLVGDVHQPLHAASRFRASDTDGDNGGNDVHLHCAPSMACASSLHSQWDGVLGNTHDLGTITTLGTTLDGRPVPPGADVTDPDTWTTESLDLARNDVYKDHAGQPLGDPLASIDAAYVAHAKSVAELRVILAARRLAALINTALGSS
jgi:hypothetical protein